MIEQARKELSSWNWNQRIKGVLLQGPEAELDIDWEARIARVYGLDVASDARDFNRKVQQIISQINRRRLKILHHLKRWEFDEAIELSCECAEYESRLWEYPAWRQIASAIDELKTEI